MADEHKRTMVEAPEAPVMVRMDHVSKHFGHFKALQDVSFQLRKGEVLGFLGPNGAGKTTTMRILAGFFSPSMGKVFIGEKELFKNPQKIKRQIGYLPESMSLYGDMRVGEFLTFVARLKRVPRRKMRADLEEKLNRCGLWEVKNRLISFLSKGHRQRVGLAQALIGDPDVLVLDEPTSGLDPKQIIEIRTLIRELGRERSLVLSTHILPEVSMVCDRVVIINQGKVVAAGTTDELESGLQTKHEVMITVGERHRKEEILEMFHSVKGVERVTLTEERGDRISFSLGVARGIEARPEITRLFVERGIPILEIRSGRLSLEEIFLKLVVQENHSEHWS
ncbi:MAG TPA: ABC transporter ATP-binding protein [bacterium]|nr:ABC transporter ATP-binding protein [bacterium]